MANLLFNVKEAMNVCLRDPRILKYSIFVKRFLPFNGPSAIEDVPGIIDVPWVESHRKIGGCKLSLKNPAYFQPVLSHIIKIQEAHLVDVLHVLMKSVNLMERRMLLLLIHQIPTILLQQKKVTKPILQPSHEIPNKVETKYKRIS